MHISGKIFAFLVICCGLASTLLTAKLIQVRNSWTAKSQRFETDYPKTRTELEKARAEFTALRSGIEATIRDWGGTFAVETQIANPLEGRLQIAAGTNLGLKEQMVIHGFQLLPDQTSIYRGPFVIATAQADASLVVPQWRLRGDDLQASNDVPAWQGGTWRWRTMIPSGFSDRFNDQVTAFTLADETLADRQQSLALQQRIVADSERQLQYRTAELVGGQELPQDPALNPEDREGLVAPLEAEEESRNKILLTIADLRLAVRQERDRVRQLEQENLDLLRQLPQPANPATVSKRPTGSTN